MRIDGTPTSQSSLGFNPANANRVAAPDGAAADAATIVDTAAGGEFQPSSDFLPLIAALARIPQVRQETVGEVANRLTGGDLSTPQARQQTVESILGSAPGHD